MSSLKKNISISFAAQIVSVAVSLVLNLFIPKAIDIVQFAHWQTYSLYIAFVGIFHFGILDGILLRYSEYDEDRLDWSAIRSQMNAVILLSTGAAVAILLSCAFFDSIEYRIVCVFLSAGVLSKNLVTFNLYLFQSTNRISRYVSIVLIQKIVFGIGIVSLMLSGVKSFPLYCMMDILGDIVSLTVGLIWNNKLFLAEKCTTSVFKKELKANFTTGVFLMLSNWIAMLFVGITRMSVQWFGDIETFGIVSYAFSLSNLFLSFIAAVSIVVFPAMKRAGKDELTAAYIKTRKALGPFMLVALTLYFPVCTLLKLWLPQYDESYVFLGIILPFVVFSAIVNLLSNNMLNSNRRERVMFKINVLALVLSAFSCIIAAVVIHNIHILVASVVAPAILRAVLAECEVAKITKFSFLRQNVIEIIVSVCFIVSVTFLTPVKAGMAYATCLVAMFLCLHSPLVKKRI